MHSQKAKSNYKLHHVGPSSWNNSTPTGQIFVKCDMWVFLKKSVEKIQVSIRCHKNLWVRADLCTIKTVSCQVLRRMRNVAGKSCIAKHTNYVQFFFSQKSYYLWENVEEYCTAKQATDYNIICWVCLSCWKRKATDTHSKYVILIAFPWQKWLLELALNIIYTLPVLLHHRRDVQAVCSKSAQAVRPNPSG